MNNLEYYYEYIIKHDLINKFKYYGLKNLPKLKKIFLNFGCPNHTIKNLAPALLFLELLCDKNGSLTKTKKVNIFIKIKKGTPIGCLVILTRIKMYKFLFKLILEILPSLKNFKGIPYVYKKLKTNSFSFYIKDLTILKEFNPHYHLFNDLPSLNITILTNTNTKTELMYLLRSFKLPLRVKN